jgi:hypothetical protein
MGIRAGYEAWKLRFIATGVENPWQSGNQKAHFYRCPQNGGFIE